MQTLNSAQKGLAFLAWFKVLLGILLVLGALQSSTAAPTNSTTLSKERNSLAPSTLTETANEAPELRHAVGHDHQKECRVENTTSSRTKPIFRTGSASTTLYTDASSLGGHSRDFVSQYHGESKPQKHEQNCNQGHHEQHHNFSISANWQSRSSLAKSATPVNSSELSPSPVGALLAKRSFVPTAAQCDAALAANGWDSSTTMFFSNANGLAWSKKLGRVLFSQKTAYGKYLEPGNKDSPFFGWDPTKEEGDTFEKDVFNIMSERFAEGTTGTTYVVLNPDKPPRVDSTWLTIEWEILRRKNIKVFSCNEKDLEEEPKQIWPPPQQGAPPPKA